MLGGEEGGRPRFPANVVRMDAVSGRPLYVPFAGHREAVLLDREKKEAREIAEQRGPVGACSTRDGSRRARIDSVFGIHPQPDCWAAGPLDGAAGHAVHASGAFLMPM